MRIYLPSTLAELGRPEGLEPRVVHAVTPALRAALPDEDEEGLEYAAQLLAADDSVDRLAEAPTAATRWRRVVVAADVSEDAVSAIADDDETASAVRLLAPVPWSEVACAHVDEEAAAAEVRAAAEGDDDAAERLVDRDLLWFDVSELPGLARSAR